MVKKSKKSTKKAFVSGRFLPLLIGIVVGLAIAFSIITFSRATKIAYYCDGFEFSYPARWYAGTANTTCHISNVSAARWPAIEGFEDKGEVGITATVDTMPTETSLLDYVTDKWDQSRQAESAYYKYEVKSIKEVAFRNGKAVEAVVKGGHYNRTETYYYYKGSNNNNAVIQMTVTSSSKKLLKKGLSIIQSVRPAELERP